VHAPVSNPIVASSSGFLFGFPYGLRFHESRRAVAVPFDLLLCGSCSIGRYAHAYG